MTKKQLSLANKLFKMVYQWGRVGVKTNYKCFAYQESIAELLLTMTNKKINNLKN